MLNILIIDDEQPARDRLRRLVNAIPDFRVAGEAVNGIEALDKIRELSPDILLLDISMPGMDGMSLARTLQDTGASPAVCSSRNSKSAAVNVASSASSSAVGSCG